MICHSSMLYPNTISENILETPASVSISQYFGGFFVDSPTLLQFRQELNISQAKGQGEMLTQGSSSVLKTNWFQLLAVFSPASPGLP